MSFLEDTQPAASDDRRLSKERARKARIAHEVISNKDRQDARDAARFLGIIYFLLLLPFAAWNGFVLSKLWTWFVSPLGVSHITIWQGAGLSLIVRFLTYTLQVNRRDDGDPISVILKGFGQAIFIPAFVLLFGLIFHALGA